MKHYSVMLKEAIDGLNIQEDGIYVDATLGYGGHSSKILSKLKKGHLYSFDQDEEAILDSTSRLTKIGDNFTIIKSNFKNITVKLNELNVTKVNGILYDLGVSSPQLDVGERGFSYHLNGRLDMRMDKENKLSAYEVVNNYPYEKLVKIFREYGEEKFSTSIAKGIINNRPIETTLELAEIIKENVPFSYRKDKHPARKVFQAIRIEVNDEMNVLNDSLRQALELLTLNGRLCVITFHSLEDKLVKKIFREVSSIPNELSKLPIIPEEYLPKYKEIKTLTPNLKEISSNNRSRSATLRVIERIR